MRTFLVAVVVVVFAGSLPAKQPKKFESKDGKFTATFPGDPKTITPKAGGLDLNITIFEKGKEPKDAGAVFGHLLRHPRRSGEGREAGEAPGERREGAGRHLQGEGHEIDGVDVRRGKVSGPRHHR